MKLDGIMFDHSIFSPFVVGFVRAEAFFRPHISDMVVMHVLVKGEIFDFIRCRCAKNWMVLCELHQDWF